jgi:hypothetical protein
MVTESLAIVKPNAITSQADKMMLRLSNYGFTVAAGTLQRAYRTNAKRLLAFASKPLAHISLGDLQAFRDSLTGLAPSSQAQRSRL